MLRLKPDEVDYVIYHGGCADGFGAAFAAWKFFTEKYPEKKLIYYPAAIGSLPPNNLVNKNILICDYSYKKNYYWK